MNKQIRIPNKKSYWVNFKKHLENKNPQEWFKVTDAIIANALVEDCDAILYSMCVEFPDEETFVQFKLVWS